MRLRSAGLLLLALVLVGAPVSAAGPAPQVTDDCGDAGTTGEWNGDSMEFEETRPHLDLKSGRVSGLYADGAFAGFTAAITVCGDISATEGGYNIGWSYGGDCYGNVSWTLAGRQTPAREGANGHFQVASATQAVVTEECYHEPETPVLDSGVETVYRTALPAEAVSFAGDTVTFTVAKSALPEAAARRFASGTVWANIGAVSMDQGPSLWAAYADTEGNRGRLNVRADFALGGASYTVGEDATP